MHPLKWLDNQTKQRPFFSALVVLLMVVVPGYFLLEDTQREVCERANDFRQAYVDQWEPILAESPPPKKPPDGSPKEVVDAYEAQVKTREIFENSLATDFAQQDC